ncbi:peptidase A24A domain protein [Thermosinus carboxydivorans Nor1]|uniref:Prepilin leader peptidase/N-methyltransferase n=1 Tax=Thermosinus carboxydivorans Nor1 TaxID=401526 RepID=A1HQ20_9FIRM|nr:A24 family peptidase [Thermosinus carboxydivorans]EAX47870.1 peptidase A24A domain protein [Thermosinus carboxydivorans Nor1]
MFTLFIFILGLIIGSFLNVCIYRLPLGASIVTPPSHCFACGTRLKFWDLIPVISYIALRGRCRYCGAAFSLRYLLVELLTAFLFTWCFQVTGLGPELIKALIFISFLIVVAFIDYDHQLILDKVLIWLGGAGVFINLGLGFTGLTDMIAGSLLGGGLLLVIAIASRGGMGGGDIKFAACLGLWLGWKLTLLALFLSFLLGGVGGIVLLTLKRKGRKDFIPFGPFLALGAFFAGLYGWQILRWYFQHFMR